MRVMIVHSRYRTAAPSGENNVVDQEAAGLAALGHRVERFERAGDEVAGWSPGAKAMLPLRIPYNAPVRDALATRLSAGRPDVVHVHNTFPLLSPSVLAACRDAGVPVVATVHNYKLLCASGDLFRNGVPCHDCAGGALWPALAHGCYRGSRAATVPVVAGMGLNREAWRALVSAYIFISAAQRDLMRGLRLPEDRVFVKGNFVADPAPARPREHAVAYLGRLDAAKGVPELIRAWDLFRSGHPGSRLRLVVAGGGPLEPQVAAWSARTPSVELAGRLDGTTARELIAGSLAVLVPSAWEETFGLVAIEAMSAGVAPVAPGRGSFPELISDGVDGALYAPGSPADLARVIADVDRRPEHYQALGRAGLVTAERRFGTRDNLDQLVGIYRFAIARPVRAADRSGAREPVGGPS